MTRGRGDSPGGGAARSAPLFLAGLVLAQIGAFLSFLPLLQILLPLKATALAGAERAGVLGLATALGALAGGLANVAAGHRSDRTRSRFGRRRPWILAGLVAVILSYGLIWRASSATALVAAVVGFQVAFNMMFAPLLALFADRVPATARGWAAGLSSLAYPVGLSVGAVVIGSAVAGEAMKYLVLAGLVAIAVGPFALTLREPKAQSRTAEPPRPVVAEHHARVRDFRLGWIGRALVVSNYAIAQVYLLFFLQDAIRYDHAGLGAAAGGVATMSTVFGGLYVVAALASGRLSDRLGRRRPFVIGGALTVCAGMAGLALATSWPAALGAYAVMGLGAGCHTSSEFALMTQLLPSRDGAARDLGLLNFANIAPQALAPLAGMLLVGAPTGGIRWLFAAGAVCAAGSALVVAAMRTAR